MLRDIDDLVNLAREHASEVSSACVEFNRMIIEPLKEEVDEEERDRIAQLDFQKFWETRRIRKYLKDADLDSEQQRLIDGLRELETIEEYGIGHLWAALYDAPPFIDAQSIGLD